MPVAIPMAPNTISFTRLRCKFAAQRRFQGGIRRPETLFVWLTLRFNRARDDFGDVFDLHLLFGLDTFDAIIEHGDAEGAGGGEDFGPRLQRLVDTRLIDAFADLLLHPGAPTTAAAAEALVPVAAHLRHAVAIEYSEHAARLVVDIVVATNVARVVIGELALVKAFGQV